MRGFGLGLLLACAPALAAAAPAATFALEGATVHVERGQKLEGATVVVQGGKITAVGKGVAVPAGATRIDARGKVITAGLVDAEGALGLVEVDGVAATTEGAIETPGDEIHAAYRVVDGYNPASVGIPIARSGGVTAAVAAPRGSLIAGTSAWMSLAGDASAAEAAVKAPAAMVVTLGEAALDDAGGSRGYALEQLREALDDAAQYAKRRADYEKNQTRELAASRLDLEALLPVVQGRLPLAVHVDRAADIQAVVKLATELKLAVILVGATEAWEVAGELAAAKIGVILDPTRNLPSSFDDLHVRDDAAALLARAGVRIAISTLGGDPRTLRQRAGIAVANGLAWDDALAAITSAPAEIFGVPGRGTIAAGAAADLVVWSGDPLELSSRAERVYIGGVEQSLESHQTELLRKYRKLD
jgi:imidazolonepropionase-like amidohydrolase